MYGLVCAALKGIIMVNLSPLVLSRVLLLTILVASLKIGLDSRKHNWLEISPPWKVIGNS